MKPTFKQRLLLGSITLALAAPSAFGVTETFNTPGTVNWTCPAGVESVQVECWGGGGAGGAGRKNTDTNTNTSQNGGGGGGGAYARMLSVPVTAGSSYVITIPAAVLSGSAGTTTNNAGAVNGGNISFVGDGAITVTANGGVGGRNAYTTVNSTVAVVGGAGGTGVGDIGGTFAGGAGAASITGASNYSGGGGGGAGNANPGGAGTAEAGGAGGVAGGGAGGSGRGFGNSNPGAGTNGTNPGGGGGGGHNQGLSTRLGGNGGVGQMILNYTALPPNVKANNADPLNLSSSWTAFVPNGTFGTWDSTVTGPNTTSLGADLTFSGIRILDPGGLVTINAGNTLTLGAAAIDIDLSSASLRDLTLNCDVALGAANVWNVASGRTATLGGAVSGPATVAKQGSGTVTLSGASTYTGNTVVSGGVLNVSGTLTGNTTASTLAYGGTAANTVVNVSNDMTLFTTSAATVAGSNAVYNQTAGTVNLSPTAQSFLSTNGYSYFNLTGGTVKPNSGNFLLTNGATATGVAYVGGSGILDLTSTTINNGGVTFAGSGTLTVGPGGTVSRTTGGGTAFYLTAFANATGVINVAGGNLDLGTGFLRMGNGATLTGINGSVNLAGGTLTMGANFTNNASGGNLYANFAGGTLKASGNLNSPFSTGGGVTTISTIFGPISNFAAVGNTSLDFTGGLTVDTNGNNVTYGNGLLGVTGNGVKQTNISISGGSDYLGAPAVTFTGGTLATDGTPASGYALIAGGAVTGIVITSPGEYSVDPTVTLTGGGGTGAGVSLSALTANPTDSGLTKLNGGTLTLSGANTYTGATLVSGGALKFTTAFGSSTNVTVADTAQFGTLVAANDGQWINTGNLSLNNNSAVDIDYGSTTPSSTFAPIQINNFVPGANTGVKIEAASFSGLAVSQSYPLVTWTGSGPANASAFTSVLTHRLAGTFSVSSNTLFLTVTKNAAGVAISWNKGDGPWNTTDVNWLAGDLTPTTYFDALDSVLFDDAAGVSGNPTITLSSPVSPLGVTMNSSNHDYTLSGSGGIGGAGGLILDIGNTKTLTLATVNTYTGGTVINGGTLKLSGSGTLGSVNSTVAVSTGGTLDLNGTSQTITIAAGSGTIANNSGSGTSILTFNGSANAGTPLIVDSTSNAGGNVAVVVTASSQTFNAANTYSGGTTVNGGAFFYINPGAAGTGAINLLASNSGLVLNASSLANDITGAGYISNNVNAAATITLTGTLNTSGIVTFRNAANVYDFAGIGTSMLSGSIGTLGGTNGISSAGSIVKSGSGTLTLSGTNIYTAGTTLSDGTLIANNAQALGTAASPLKLNGGILDVQTLSTAYNTTVGGNTTIQSDNATSGAGTTKTLGTLSIGAFQLNVAPGANATGSTAVIAFGNTALTGNATVSPAADSTLRLNGTVTGATFSLTVAGAGNVVFAGAAGALQNSGGLIINSGSSATISTNNAITGTIPVTVNGSLTNGGGEIFGALNGSGTINQTVNNFFTSSAIDGSFSGSITGAGGYLKQGASTQTLSGANTYTGNTVVSGAGTLILAAGGQLKFLLGGTSGANNSITGTSATLDGSFVIDTSAADALAMGTWTLENVTSLGGAYGSTFSIVGFVNAGNDKWTKTVSGGKTYTFDETTGILTLASGGYDAWKTQITNGQDLRTDDADGDGFTNLQEFLFGTSPIASNGSLVTTTTSGGNIVLRWLQREAGSTYTLEQSATLALGSWTPATPIPALDSIQTGAPTDYDYYTVTIPTGGGKLFFRIDGVEN